MDNYPDIQSKIEKLKYVSLSREVPGELTIIIQFEGGGAALKLLSEERSNSVIAKLRYLAYLLEQGVAARQNNPQP